MAFNCVANWNVQIGNALKDISDTVYDAIVSGGKCLADTYCFITGGSADTAFGAHVDFEDSVIIDLAGSGRVVREWLRGASYGALKNGAAGHLGSSFKWEPYAADSRLEVLVPGSIYNIPTLCPHLFHTLGAGFFQGLSVVRCSSVSERDVFDVNVEALRPINDLDFLASHDFIPVARQVLDSFDRSFDVGLSAIRCRGRRISLTHDEIDSVEAVCRDGNLKERGGFNTVAAKLYHLGALDVL